MASSPPKGVFSRLPREESLKNYYKILDVPATATPEEIKKAFRALALRYHPDRAPDNPFAPDHFKEIQEAYETLSHPDLRARYDEERWLRGLSTRSRNAQHITPQWVLDEAVRLRQHMSQVDTYRMNHGALRDYIIALLSPEHLSIVQSEPEMHPAIIKELLASTSHLYYRYSQDVAQQLLLLAGSNKEAQATINLWLAARQSEAKWNRYRPLIVIVFALIICAIIWLIR